MLIDSTSPDGKRHIYTGKRWTDERFAVATTANFRCEGCLRREPLPFNAYAQAHHRLGKGMGNAHGDDRQYVPMQTIESQPNLARWRWWRGLLYTCQIGHERLEKQNTKDFKLNLRQFCECGLLLI